MSTKEREEPRRLWAGLVVEIRASGLGRAEWCRQNGYKVRHLHYWIHKLSAPDASASDSADWIYPRPAPVRGPGVIMMGNLGGSEFQRVYLAYGPTDMRKSIDGLAAVVQVSFQLDPFAPAVFVFCNVSVK